MGKQESNERYYRKDVKGNYLYNKSEINYYKLSQSVDVIDNQLLGDFNNKGAYEMDSAVLQQLIKLQKVYQYSFGSTMFCQSANEVGEYGKIDFAIKIKRDIPSKGMALAELYVLETIDRANGYYQNTNSARISSFSNIDSGSFVADALKQFNVVYKKETGLTNKEFNDDVELIIARKKLLDEKKKILMPELDGQYKALFDKRVKALGESVVGKKILEKFNADTYKVSGWFVKKDMPGYYRYLNQILDGLIEQNQEEVMGDLKLNLTLNKINNELIKNVGSMIDKNVPKLDPDHTYVANEQKEVASGKKLSVKEQKTPIVDKEKGKPENETPSKENSSSGEQNASGSNKKDENQAEDEDNSKKDELGDGFVF